MLLNAAKCQGYNFYRFWFIKEKPTGGGEGGRGVKLPPIHPPRLALRSTLEVNKASSWDKSFKNVI